MKLHNKKLHNLCSSPKRCRYNTGLIYVSKTILLISSFREALENFRKKNFIPPFSLYYAFLGILQVTISPNMLEI
jgi:hypothetical protein